jgi:hypothetical protein
MRSVSSTRCCQNVVINNRPTTRAGQTPPVLSDNSVPVAPINGAWSSLDSGTSIPLNGAHLSTKAFDTCLAAKGCVLPSSRV